MKDKNDECGNRFLVDSFLRQFSDLFAESQISLPIYRSTENSKILSIIQHLQ